MFEWVEQPYRNSEANMPCPWLSPLGAQKSSICPLILLRGRELILTAAGFCIQKYFAEMFSSRWTICHVFCFFLKLTAFSSWLFSDQSCLGFLQDYVDAPLSIPVSLTQPLNIDWSEYQVSKAGISVGGQRFTQEGSVKIWGLPCSGCHNLAHFIASQWERGCFLVVQNGGGNPVPRRSVALCVPWQLAVTSNLFLWLA